MRSLNLRLQQAGLKALALVSLFLLAQFCTTEVREESPLKPVFDHFEVTFKDWALDASQGQVLEMENGSKVHIPAEAFVDASGEPVQGKIDVEYREFHSSAEIISSGIPMVYDSAGSRFNFESAGMFEFRGYQEGQPIFIAPDKSVQVDMASLKDESFNFYYLAENQVNALSQTFSLIPSLQAQSVSELPAGNWQLLSTSQAAQVNAEKSQKLEALQEELSEILPDEPLAPQGIQADDVAFEFDLDVSDFPELAGFEGIIWVFDKELGGGEAPQDQAWVFAQEWNQAQLLPKPERPMSYSLVLSNAQNRYETQVKPVLSGQNLAQAQRDFEQKMQTYKKVEAENAERIAKIKEEQAFYRRQSNFVRSFRIQNMGVYNCDRIYNDPGALMVQASFQVDQQAVDEGKINIFLISNGNVIQYSRPRGWNSFEKFRFNPQAQNRMVAVLPQDRVAVFDQEAFDKIKQNPPENGAALQFDLKSYEEPVASVEDLQRLINTL